MASKKTEAIEEQKVQETPEQETQAQNTEIQGAETEKPAEDIEQLKKKIAELEAQLEKTLPMGETIETPVTTEDPDDEWNQFVTINVPRHGKGQEKYFFVSVNHRTCQIPADGKYHKIRKPFAEILMMSLEAEAEAERYAEEDVPHDSSPENFGQLMRQMNEMKKLLKDHGII